MKTNKQTGSNKPSGDLEVFTTAEVVLGECRDAVFTRPHDAATGFGELKVERRAEEVESREEKE